MNVPRASAAARMSFQKRIASVVPTPYHPLQTPGVILGALALDVIEPAAHPVNPLHRLAVGREQQDGAVVDDDLHGALVVFDA